MASTVSERVELAMFCSSRDWSKAIRVLDSLLSQSCVIQDICNRAFCYSQLELHKHVIKDCDKALQLDPTLLQVYILKGHAFSALGKKYDALTAWERGYEYAVRQSADLKQLLELEELLAAAKQSRATSSDKHLPELSKLSVSESGLPNSEQASEVSNSHAMPIVDNGPQSDSCEVLQTGKSKPDEGSYVLNGSSNKKSYNEQQNETYDRTSIGTHINTIESGSGSEDCSRIDGTSDLNSISIVSSNLSDATNVRSQLNDKSAICGEVLDAKGNKKFCVTRISKTRSINVDFRLSRGIAQVNEGQYAHAISIFDQKKPVGAEILREDPNYPEALIGRGTAYAFKRELDTAIADFTKAIKSNPSAGEAWKRRGQARAALGESFEAIADLTKALEFEPNSADILHERDLLRDITCEDYFSMVWEITEMLSNLSIGLSLESSNIECLYLRASCYHAVGDYGEAVKDYDAALDLELDSMDKFVLQCLAFYQKEMALYTASKINSEFSWFDVDGHIDPLFKEYWCKRLHPKNVCEKVYRQPPLRDLLKKWKLRKQEFTLTKQKTALLAVADRIGEKIQYHCPGFLPNRRQHRMAGLAAIEIAQKVVRAWRSIQLEWKHYVKGTSKHAKRTRRNEKYIIPSQNRGGAGCSTSSFSEASSSTLEDKSSGRLVMSWRYLYSLAVKWRQISEPCDPVLWVNKLSEEFNSGFGSNTPLILGQAKVVRYFPNFKRMLDIAKAVIKEKMCAYNKADRVIDLSKEEKLQEIMSAEACSDFYKAVDEDFWVSTWCNSSAFEGRRLEGTRITLVKMGECGFDFAIRTPCSTSRWDDFDSEMTVAWEAICNAYCGETYGSTDFDVLENVRDAILRMTYYWYNFMPLSRGTAAVGLIVMLGLLLTEQHLENLLQQQYSIGYLWVDII